MSTEARGKLSQSLKKKWKDPEHRAAVSAKLQARAGGPHVGCALQCPSSRSHYTHPCA